MERSEIKAKKSYGKYLILFDWTKTRDGKPMTRQFCDSTLIRLDQVMSWRWRNSKKF